MATVYIVLCLLTLHARFSDIKGINVLTNISLLNLNSSELVKALITEQKRICPYIALCNSSNSSVFTSSFSSSSPCCQKCSCDNTCIAKGSCCPDFKEEDFNISVLPSEYTTEPFINDVNKTAIDRQLCVKMQHGSILNRDGFTMVALCPFQFKDLDVKRKCEMKIDYLKSFDIYDHIPVTDTVSGLTFKNRFCELCNKGKDYISAIVWNVWLKCKQQKFVFKNNLENSPFEFAQSIIREKTCNIAFEYENLIQDLSFTLNFCQADNIIDSCYDKNSNYVLQSLCSKAFWPIKARLFPGTRIYKNYACLLCNGIEFKEMCYAFNNENERLFAASLKSFIGNTKQLSTLNTTDDTKTRNPRSGSKVIERFFPNDDGYVYCQKGYVYDSKKDTCRLVLCPLYFFVKNGDCAPMFGVMKGIVYQVLLQADVLVSLQDEDQEKVETAIATSLDNLLRDRLGEGQFQYYIWKSNTMPLQAREYGQYLVILSISANFDHGKYISILKMINNFVLLKQQLEIIIDNETINQLFEVVISFDTSSQLYINLKPQTRYCNYCFDMIKSNNGLGNGKVKDNRTSFFISPINLCFRVSRSEHEVEKIGRQHISSSGTVLSQPNYELVHYKEKKLYLVCLSHAFNDVPKTVSYIFLNKNDTNYKFQLRPTTNNRINYTGSSDIKTGDKEETIFTKSGVATLVTVGVVAFVIVIGQITKRLTTKGRNSEPAEGIVTEMAEAYRVSLDNVRNTDSEGKDKTAGNRGDQVEKIQAVRKEYEIENESSDRPNADWTEEKIQNE